MWACTVKYKDKVTFTTKWPMYEHMLDHLASQNETEIEWISITIMDGEI